MRSAGIIALLFLAGCARPDDPNHVTFWALGREGEVVAQMMPEFERRSGIKVRVQQIPWSAAHEKLLTAYVGESVPDVAQVGNTWIPEFEAIRAIDDLTSRAAASKVVRRDDYFEGIWQTNLIGDDLYGVPWYVDTRVLFYRTDILAGAGLSEAPRSWSEWRTLMQRISGEGRHAILLPTDEWPQPVILALQSGAELLTAQGRHGAFGHADFIRGFDFYIEMFRRGWAPVYSRTQVSNRYLQFAQGEFAMMITGPWEVAEFRNRLPATVQDHWMTAPLPAPDGEAWPGVSLAGGSSLVIFRDSPRKDAAWKLIEYLSEPEQQVRFFDLMRNLPARKSAWEAKILRDDPYLRAFRTQLERVVPTPRVAEWERMTTFIAEAGERAIRTGRPTAEICAALDARADQLLEKRRWMLDRERDRASAR
jgi:multiple sugar transport system substrate-binding protein